MRLTGHSLLLAGVTASLYASMNPHVALAADVSQTITTAAAPAAAGPYSQAVSRGEMVFVSGQLGLDPTSGQLVPGGVEEQTRRAMANIGAILAAAKLSFADVVKTTIYVTNMADFAAVNKVYAESFKSGSPAPARATVGVAALPRGAAIEIDAVAVGRP